MEYLAQHGELSPPGSGDGKPATVNVVLDLGTGVTSISKEL